MTDLQSDYQGPLKGQVGLPNTAYTSTVHFESELNKVFCASWMCIGFVEDVPEVGDIAPVTFAGIPMLMVRGRD